MNCTRQIGETAGRRRDEAQGKLVPFAGLKRRGLLFVRVSFRLEELNGVDGCIWGATDLRVFHVAFVGMGRCCEVGER